MAERQKPKAVERGPRCRGRPPLISTDRLLEHAREEFLERGIRATTADVAARAGVSEGVIFHRFKSKDALFRAAMRFDPDEMPRVLEAFVEGAGRGDLRETLLAFAERTLELGRVALPVMMMSWSNPTGKYSLEASLQRGDGYCAVMSVVNAFFERELHARGHSQVDTELLTRIFMGSLHHFCMTELFLVNRGPGHLSAREFVRGLVDVLMAAVGAAARPSEPAHLPRKLSRL